MSVINMRAVDDRRFLQRRPPPAGLNTFRWPLTPADWNWQDNTATMAYAWKGCIEAQKKLNVIWCVACVEYRRSVA